MVRTKLSVTSGWAAMIAGLIWLFWVAMPWSPALVFALGLSLLSLIGLHAGPLRTMPRICWVGLLISLAGLGLALVCAGMIAGAADSQHTRTFERLIVVSIISSGAGLVLRGAVAQHPDAPGHWRGLFLQLGILMIIAMTWFWFFILNRPYPPQLASVVWLGLGVLVGIAWMRLGFSLVSALEEADMARSSKRS